MPRYDEGEEDDDDYYAPSVAHAIARSSRYEMEMVYREMIRRAPHVESFNPAMLRHPNPGQARYATQAEIHAALQGRDEGGNFRTPQRPDAQAAGRARPEDLMFAD